MGPLLLLLGLAALVFGVVSVAEANGRSWPGWGLICVGAYILITRLT